MQSEILLERMEETQNPRPLLHGLKKSLPTNNTFQESIWDQCSAITAQGISEVAGSPDLDALLRHADAFLRPSWAKGGLYYARCDQYWDNEGNYTYGEPYSGNAAIGYARLNVRGGQKEMWEHPWTRDQVAKTPWVDGLGLEMEVDCLRGRWDDERNSMIVTLRTWNGSEMEVTPIVRNLPVGTYGVYVDGELKNVAEVTSTSDRIDVELLVAGEDVDLVVLRA